MHTWLVEVLPHWRLLYLRLSAAAEEQLKIEKTPFVLFSPLSFSKYLILPSELGEPLHGAAFMEKFITFRIFPAPYTAKCCGITRNNREHSFKVTQLVPLDCSMHRIFMNGPALAFIVSYTGGINNIPYYQHFSQLD